MFKRMAQGLRKSPLTFQRLINSVLSGLPGKHVFCFLDDIIASKDSEEHFSVLSQVLLRFESAGLKIKLGKCTLVRKQIKFLGHKVDKDGIHTLDCKFQVIQSFLASTCPDQIRQFLGLAGFCHQFNQNFSLIAQPLTHLLKEILNSSGLRRNNTHLIISSLPYVVPQYLLSPTLIRNSLFELLQDRCCSRAT